MKITVLVDNNTYIDQYYLGEPAFSLWLEDGADCYLFDTGYSSVFLENAKKLKIDFEKCSGIVLSHGHNDHTGGLEHFIPQKKLSLLCHPKSLLAKREETEAIGNPVTEADLNERFDLRKSAEPVRLTERLWYLGEIPDHYDFEAREAIGEYQTKKGWEPDLVKDDTALAYETAEGLFIITGCSHSGICNICEYAKEVTGSTKIRGVLGGFHLFDLDKKLEETIEYFKENEVTELYPCHCVSFQAKAKIHEELPIVEVGVGMKLEI